MSSHHIVRDEQEPALILHRLEAFSEPNLHSLLEWSPTVIGCEPAIEKYTSLGHKLDVALISLAQIERYKSLLSDQVPIKLVAVHGNDFLMTGLTLLQKDNHRAVNVVTDASCMPEVIQMCEQWVSRLDLAVFTENQRILFVKSKTFKKWLSAGTELSIQALSGFGIWNTRGTDEDLIDYKTDCHDLVKTTEGEVAISCDQSPFLVIEQL